LKAKPNYITTGTAGGFETAVNKATTKTVYFQGSPGMLYPEVGDAEGMLKALR
jgi:hypothetical protein